MCHMVNLFINHRHSVFHQSKCISRKAPPFLSASGNQHIHPSIRDISGRNNIWYLNVAVNLIYTTCVGKRGSVIIDWYDMQIKVIGTENNCRVRIPMYRCYIWTKARTKPHRKCQDYVFVKWEYWSTMLKIRHYLRHENKVNGNKVLIKYY